MKYESGSSQQVSALGRGDIVTGRGDCRNISPVKVGCSRPTGIPQELAISTDVSFAVLALRAPP